MPKVQVNFQQGIAVAISLTLPFSSFSRQANANPAVLAPAVLCAGTAGVGCMLIGVGILGGTVVYLVYQNDKGRKVKLTPNGGLFRHEDYTQDSAMHFQPEAGNEILEGFGLKLTRMGETPPLQFICRIFFANWYQDTGISQSPMPCLANPHSPFAVPQHHCIGNFGC